MTTYTRDHEQAPSTSPTAEALQEYTRTILDAVFNVSATPERTTVPVARTAPVPTAVFTQEAAPQEAPQSTDPVEIARQLARQRVTESFED